MDLDIYSFNCYNQDTLTRKLLSFNMTGLSSFAFLVSISVFTFCKRAFFSCLFKGCIDMSFSREEDILYEDK